MEKEEYDWNFWEKYYLDLEKTDYRQKFQTAFYIPFNLSFIEGVGSGLVFDWSYTE